MSKLKNYNLIKAATWYTFGNILIRGISFFVLPIFTSLMSTHDFGIYSVYTSYLSLFETLILFGLSSTVSLAKFSDDLDYNSYMSTILVIPPILTLAAGIIINLIVGITGSVLSMDATLWNFLLINAAASAVGSIIQARLVLNGEYKLYIVYSFLCTVGNVGLSLLLCYTVFRNHDIYMARVIGNCASSVICTVFLVVRSKIAHGVHPAYFKTAFLWGVPLLFHTLATVVLTQTDRILIRYMDSYSSAGIYSIAVTIITIPLLLQSSISSAWSPWFYNELSQKNYAGIRKLNDKYIVLFAVIIAEIMLICPEIIHLFTAKEYWDSIYSLAPLLISVFGEMLYCIPTSVEYFYKKTTTIMTGTLIAVCVNIVLDILFIRFFGYIAAAYATTISKLVLFLMHYLFAKKAEPNAVFHWRYAGGCLLSLCGLNVLVVYGINWAVLRLALFVAIGIAFLWGVWKNKSDLLLLTGKKIPPANSEDNQPADSPATQQEDQP